MSLGTCIKNSNVIIICKGLPKISPNILRPILNFRPTCKSRILLLTAIIHAAQMSFLMTALPFRWQHNTVFIKMVPGHSEGGNFIFLNENILFGDILLDESVPAAKFPGGSPKEFTDVALPYINTLPPKRGVSRSWRVFFFYMNITAISIRRKNKC